MFGIGSTELLVILLVALIVLGPKSLASVSRALGKAMGEFRRVSTDFQRTLNVETAEADAREEQEKRRRQRAAEAQAAKNEPCPESGQKEKSEYMPPDGSAVAAAMAKAQAEADPAKCGNVPKNTSGENPHV